MRISNSPIIAKNKNRSLHLLNKTFFAQTKLTIHFINIHHKSHFECNFDFWNGFKGSELTYVAKMIYLFPNQILLNQIIIFLMTL